MTLRSKSVLKLQGNQSRKALLQASISQGKFWRRLPALPPRPGAGVLFRHHPRFPARRQAAIIFLKFDDSRCTCYNTQVYELYLGNTYFGPDNVIGPVDSKMNKTQAFSASLNLAQWFSNVAFNKEVSCIYLSPSKSKVGGFCIFNKLPEVSQAQAGTSGLESASWGLLRTTEL